MTPIENLDERLAKMEESFKQAPSENQGGFWLPEPGTYQAIFRSIDMFETKADQRALLKLTFEITLDRDHNGREIDLIFNLEPDGTPDEIETKLGFLKRALKTLGAPVDEDDFSLAQVRPGSPLWDELLDVPVEIDVKDSKRINENTGRPYRNAYLSARIGDPLPTGQLPGSDIPLEPVAPAATVKDDDDDPIPF